MNYQIKHKNYGGWKNPELNLPELTTDIGLDMVESVYVGKGNCCRCGCGGDYFRPSEDPKAIKKIKHYLKKMASDNYKVESIDNYIFEIIVSERYDTRGRLSASRVATIYLHDKHKEAKEEVKEEAK
jgi:hypothetical protein